MKLTKKQIAAQEAQRVEHAKLIDEAGTLEARIAAVDPDVARLKMLKTIFQGWAADVPAANALFCEGNTHCVELSAKEFQRAISDMEAVYKALGKEKFLTLCSMTLKNLEANLTPTQAASVLTRERTGSRSVKLMARAA